MNMIADSGFAASAPHRNTLATRQSQIKERIDVESDDGENEGTG